jgi:hypothetical protein
MAQSKGFYTMFDDFEDEEQEPSSDGYLATVSIVAVIIAMFGILLLPIAPILSIFALIVSIFAKRASMPGTAPRRTANIAIVLAASLLAIGIFLNASFLMETYKPAPKDSKYDSLVSEVNR